MHRSHTRTHSLLLFHFLFRCCRWASLVLQKREKNVFLTKYVENRLYVIYLTYIWRRRKVLCAEKSQEHWLNLGNTERQRVNEKDILNQSKPNFMHLSNEWTKFGFKKTEKKLRANSLSFSIPHLFVYIDKIFRDPNPMFFFRFKWYTHSKCIYLPIYNSLESHAKTFSFQTQIWMGIFS